MDNRRIAMAGLTALLLASPARAQRGGFVAFVPAMRGGPVAPRIARPAGPMRAHHAGQRRFFVGAGLWPYYFSDSGPEPFDGPPPRVDVTPVRAVAVPLAPAKPAESLLLELRGDRWVRIASNGDAREVETPRASGSAPGLDSSNSGRAGRAESVSELPNAVLVFRDGRSQEIRKYVIAGGSVFIPSDYWTTGSWTQKIPIADVDVPETLKRNQQRGAKFALPSNPNEVMMRP
jgi:hypothetical protein